MPYDPTTDTYTCPNGNRFAPIDITKRTSKTGFKSNITVYECDGCATCPRKKDCTKSEHNRRLYVSKDFLALRDQSRNRITSPDGIALRLNRSIQAEGVFANMKQNYRFRRYLRRGKENVFTETLLYAIAYNINKLNHKRNKNHKLSSVTYYSPKVA